MNTNLHYSQIAPGLRIKYRLTVSRLLELNSASYVFCGGKIHFPVANEKSAEEKSCWLMCSFTPDIPEDQLKVEHLKIRALVLASSEEKVQKVYTKELSRESEYFKEMYKDSTGSEYEGSDDDDYDELLPIPVENWKQLMVPYNK